MTSEIRLQRYLSLCGIASRRKSEELILDGKVTVNGKVVTEMGVKVGESDDVEVEGQKVVFEKKVYFILNKPLNVLCAHDDAFGRKTVYDLVKTNEKLFSLGRLDYNSSGLIILTNDGLFAESVVHPRNEIIKEYLVESENPLSDKSVSLFLKGILIEGVSYKAHAVEKTGSNNILKIFLKEGKKREIRVVYKYFNTNIISIHRTAIGGLRLDRIKLKPGEYKEITLNELNDLIFKGSKYGQENGDRR
jgi:23S rRNA pseudouridine2605 synthase